MRQLVYAMFISNNRPLLHLQWKENLVKHQKVSKNYETDCSTRASSSLPVQTFQLKTYFCYFFCRLLILSVVKLVPVWSITPKIFFWNICHRKSPQPIFWCWGWACSVPFNNFIVNTWLSKDIPNIPRYCWTDHWITGFHKT